VSKRSGNEIEDAASELEHAKHRYLRSHGWRYTSSTPGCLWMWVKRCELETSEKRDGVTEPCWIMVSTDTAISMQRHSCAIRGNKW
jgi:hypothetical protein